MYKQNCKINAKGSQIEKILLKKISQMNHLK